MKWLPAQPLSPQISSRYIDVGKDTTDFYTVVNLSFQKENKYFIWTKLSNCIDGPIWAVGEI